MRETIKDKKQTASLKRWSVWILKDTFMMISNEDSRLSFS